MTLYYTMVFTMMITEMVIFLALIMPMHRGIKRSLYKTLNSSSVVAKLQYGMKITFLFILVLFIDSVNRVYQVQTEFSRLSGNSASVLASERSEVQARRFYSQRNMYLCGFTLFLSLVLNRVYVLNLDNLDLEDQIHKLINPQKEKGTKAH